VRDEKQFLAAIEAQPDDRSRRLVYADWLEEHGDPRAGLIRVEEEMRCLPVHSDRYWELKPRRVSLRKTARKPWLERLNYGTTDDEPIFRDVPEGWKARWRLLREFTERWLGVPMKDVGGPIPNIPRTRQKVRRLRGRNPQTGAALEYERWEFPPIEPHVSDGWPPSVREWFALIYRLREEKSLRPLFGSHFSFESNDALGSIVMTSVDGHRDSYLTRDQDSQNPDPAVHFFSHTSDTDHGSVSAHVTGFALRYLLESLHEHARRGLKEQVSAKSMGRLVRGLTELFPTRARFDGDHIFERQDAIAVLGPDPFTGLVPNDLYLHVQPRAPESAAASEILAQIDELL
jgi:uncharacterized protein (TIGR02996 family)